MSMWSPSLPAGTETKYQAILDALHRDIETGVLVPGTRLPTQRDLASRLGIAIGTVSRAYAAAERQGIVSGEVGRGTFVREPGPGIQEAAEDEDDPGLLDLSRGRLVRNPRDPTLGGTLERLSHRNDLNSLIDIYQPPVGMARHRKAGAAWISRAGLVADPGRVVVTSGAQHGAFTVLATMTKPGDVVLTEEVTYPGIAALATLLHLQLRGLPMDEHGLDPGSFESACRNASPKALFCMPTLQNPTGRTMPMARRKEIAAIAEAHDVAILEDDVNGFVPADPLPPIATLAPAHTYYITGTSKSLAPGLRIGYVVPPAHRLDRVAATIQATTWFTAPILAELVSRWIESGEADSMAGWKRAEIAARYSMALQILGPWLPSPGPASFHFWLPLPEPWRTEAFVAQARASGVVVNSSEEFVVGRGGTPHAVRVCLGATLTRARLEDAMHRLAELLRKVPGPASMVY